MSNNFLLELDTTTPEIMIIAPNYTIPNIMTEIIIKSDELLSEYQDIYIVDARGTRHNLTFKFDGNRFIGRVFLREVAVGIGIIYARVRDEVNNLSNLAQKAIDIRRSSRIFATAVINQRNVMITKNKKDVKTTSQSKVVSKLEKHREVVNQLLARGIEVYRE